MKLINYKKTGLIPGFFAAMLVLFTSCSKDNKVVDPIEISVVAESISLEAHPDRFLDNIYVVFNYNNTRYSFTARRGQGVKDNGFASIGNVNMIPSGSTLTQSTPQSLAVSSSALSNNLTLTINGDFIDVYGCGLTGGGGSTLPCDVKEFNKINIQIQPSTKLYVQGNSIFFPPSGFPDKYISDLPGLTTLVKKGMEAFNLSGTQPLALEIWGSK